MTTTRVDWYFDLISPFAYLQMKGRDRLPEGTVIVPRPVLLGAILKHWGQLGPAEIAPKRLHTYRMCAWIAGERGVPFRMPPRHPFNPVNALRVLIEAGCSLPTVERAFDFIFAEGRAPDTPEELAAFATHLGVGRPVSEIVADPDIRQRLRASTEEAIARDVYGVPTLCVGNETFWGDDATGLCAAYLRNPGLFETSAMAHLAETRVGVTRQP